MRTQIQMSESFRVELFGILSLDDNQKGAKRHEHDFSELIFISDGDFSATVESRKIQCRTGDLMLIPSGIVHEIFCEKKGTLVYLGVSYKNGEENLHKTLLTEDDFKECSEVTQLKNVLCQITKDNIVQLDGTPIYLSLYSLLRRLCFQQEKSDILTQKIKAYIRAHTEEAIALKDIGDALYMNSHYLDDCFKEKTGQTIKEYVIKCKMQKAMDLIQNSSLQISQIAERLGFDTPQYFSTKFKMYYGYSPKKFRER